MFVRGSFAQAVSLGHLGSNGGLIAPIVTLGCDPRFRRWAKQMPLVTR